MAGIRAEPAPIAQTAPPQPAPANPNRNDFLQPAPASTPRSPEEQAPVLPTPTPPTPPTLPSDETIQILVEKIEVIDSSILTPADLAPIVQPLQGRSLTLAQLRSVADQITQLYLNRGYLTSRAILVDQLVRDGVVQIRVIEGSLERIDIDGANRTNPDYIRDRINLGAGTPLNQADLENQLRLLRLDPLFENVEASLRAGTGLGRSILSVRVTEANPFSAQLSIDNYSPPDVGSERVGVYASYRNLTGWGDLMEAQIFRTTTGGSTQFDFSYRIPLNPMNGTLQLRVAPSDFEITNPNVLIDITGNADLYEVSFRQPLRRSPREELAVSVGFTYRQGSSFFNEIFPISASTTSVFKLGQDYIRRDTRGAWVLRSQFSLGTELFAATRGSEPNGQFVSWLGQVQRVQILNPRNLLILQADVQLTPDPLPSSEQFLIGGGQSVRGFRQNARIGDNGIRLAVEDRITLVRNEAGSATLQVAPFADFGIVWNDADNPVQEPDQNVLAGVGMGLLWTPFPQLSLRLDAALPLVDLDNRGENAQDQGFYFSVNYRF
ncbi:MAG TPA: ShlB/FhaC/HecB family hemolysin secretion/activation protein [Synechococcales cyanobacterium M55_K2018_004]|nr:ShlB/FhaC/HecB family hemolysin secretion/activation protein [Synechococcales cyanobacterium M55_K2018_004]